MDDYTYATGLKHANTFEKADILSGDISARVRYIKYLEGIATEHNAPYFLGIANGLWGKWKIAEHDFNDFHSIVKSYGLWYDDLQALKYAISKEG